ncbi:hypothetical protein JL100_008465 [Skermanella mucosa]|uniref:hypothetical protein n=1 Tax=Skermanella mucosa TaxID=1789672 RepID=UPI00192CE39E|nr:hypothetical protein [Skermanella mucosa]UEM22764.1 hypothetical protein JL100_008465 [Skermanella mucosa]
MDTHDPAPTPVPFAHSLPNPDERHWEPLATHLNEAGNLAAGFAAPIGFRQVARAMGVLHDAGTWQRGQRGKGVRVFYRNS